MLDFGGFLTFSRILFTKLKMATITILRRITAEGISLHYSKFRCTMCKKPQSYDLLLFENDFNDCLTNNHFNLYGMFV